MIYKLVLVPCIHSINTSLILRCLTYMCNTISKLGYTIHSSVHLCRGFCTIVLHFCGTAQLHMWLR